MVLHNPVSVYTRIIQENPGIGPYRMIQTFGTYKTIQDYKVSYRTRTIQDYEGLKKNTSLAARGALAHCLQRRILNRFY